MPMNVNELAAIFKALSDPNRLAILQMLRDECGGECRFEAGDGGKTVSEIAGCCQVGLSTVSHHLKELANADLITTEKRGKYLVAKINKETLAEVKQVLSGIEGE